jgi:hypothetical protein
MHRSLVSCVIIGVLWLTSTLPLNAISACRPKLTVTDVHFSEMIPPTLERKWSATVTADAPRCASSASGTFDLTFSRLKENGYEVLFTQQFVWKLPSVTVDMDFWADEAVERYWIQNVSPCTCAN